MEFCMIWKVLLILLLPIKFWLFLLIGIIAAMGYAYEFISGSRVLRFIGTIVLFPFVILYKIFSCIVKR
jgi:hypothetical protein